MRLATKNGLRLIASTPRPCLGYLARLDDAPCSCSATNPGGFSSLSTARLRLGSDLRSVSYSEYSTAQDSVSNTPKEHFPPPEADLHAPRAGRSLSLRWNPSVKPSPPPPPLRGLLAKSSLGRRGKSAGADLGQYYLQPNGFLRTARQSDSYGTSNRPHASFVPYPGIAQS
jgi:hypothetical protein